jgi:hypothetical protein
LILSFETEELRDICQYEEVGIAKYGEALAAMIITRIADLRAAKDLSDLLNWCSIFKTPKDKNDTYVLKFMDGISLTLVSNHRRFTQQQVGEAALGTTWRIKIISIDHESYGE